MQTKYEQFEESEEISSSKEAAREQQLVRTVYRRQLFYVKISTPTQTNTTHKEKNKFCLSAVNLAYLLGYLTVHPASQSHLLGDTQCPLLHELLQIAEKNRPA